MIKAFLATFKQLKKQEKETSVAKMLTDDPLTVELIERIAVKHDYHFEIVQKDGTVLRFYKKVNKEDFPDTGFW